MSEKIKRYRCECSKDCQAVQHWLVQRYRERGSLKSVAKGHTITGYNMLLGCPNTDLLILDKDSGHGPTN